MQLIMIQKDKRIDAYILKSADFAKPVLNHLRSLVHRHVPMLKKLLNGAFRILIIKE